MQYRDLGNCVTEVEAAPMATDQFGIEGEESALGAGGDDAPVDFFLNPALAAIQSANIACKVANVADSVLGLTAPNRLASRLLSSVLI